MKEIIEVEIGTRKVDFLNYKVDMLCVGVFSGAKKLDKLCGQLDRKLGGGIEQVMKLGDFKGKAGSSALVYGSGKIGAKRLLLVGLGEKKKLSLDSVRNAVAVAAGKAVSSKARSLGLAVHQSVTGLGAAKVGQAIAEGVYQGSYRYDEFVGESENGRLESLKAAVVDAEKSALGELEGGIAAGTIIGQSQAFARTIANRPGNVINPPELAAVAQKAAKETAGLECTVFDERQLKQKKMGGILAVGSGSASKPRLIVLEYNPATKEKVPTVGLVGKAITFDSGGISIKPSAKMADMKFDKSGGMAVLGAMKAIAQLKPAVRVIGIIPAAENMPSATSYRPGDIVTTYSGKTVEVENTDAEGRMILCDAIHYAVTQKCDTIIDIATLTGACMVALGKYKAGLMGNDDELIKQLQQASEDSGEKVWYMPSGDEYLEEMKSKIADLKNTGSRWGGACTGAAFLGQFAGKAKWAHIDMAGVDMFDAAEKFGGVGATGFGVRLLTSYILSLVKEER